MNIRESVNKHLIERRQQVSELSNKLKARAAFTAAEKAGKALKKMANINKGAMSKIGSKSLNMKARGKAMNKMAAVANKAGKQADKFYGKITG